MAAITRTVPATIARVNDHGFQTIEDPGKWWNVSKFVNPAPIIPPKGTEVTLTLDGAGYVRSIEPVPSQPSGSDPASDTPQAAEGRECPATPLGTRLACLAAAASFLAPRSEAKSSDVLAVAELFETWANH